MRRVSSKGLRRPWPRLISVARDWLEAVIRTALDAEIRDCWQPASGAIAETYVVELAGHEHRRVVCKRGGASIWTDEVIEPRVTKWVGETTALPVPTVLAQGSIAARADSARWALYEYLEGTRPTLDTPAQRDWLVTRAGAMLGQLHAAFSFDRRGGLGSTDGDLVIRPADGVSILSSRLARQVITADDAMTPAIPPVLAHGDFRPANLLVRDDRVTAVLDWGNAHITHPGFSLARAEVRFVDIPAASGRERAELRNRFRTTYTDYHQLPAFVISELPRFKALWIAQAAANLVGVARTARGRSQLRRQLREHRSRWANDI